jgi:sporulation inhibitor KapD
MKTQGIIHSYDEERRLITIQQRRKIVYYYMQNQLLKEFDKFLAPGHFVQFECDDQAVVRRGTKAHQIHHFSVIKGLRYRVAKVFYDDATLRHHMLSTIQAHTNKLFLDVELSMHPYEKGITFTQEIIQVGALLEVDGEVIDTFHHYIQPIVHQELTQRTKDFLHIDETTMESAVEPIKWYQTLKRWMQEYQPQIYVWGRNDFLSLDEFYSLLQEPSLTPRKAFVDIMKMIKQFRHQKNDIGLLQCAIDMGHQVSHQTHDAFDDAKLTRFITQQFIQELKQVTKNK